MCYSNRVMVGVGGFIDWRWKGIGDVAEKTSFYEASNGISQISDIDLFVDLIIPLRAHLWYWAARECWNYLSIAWYKYQNLLHTQFIMLKHKWVFLSFISEEFVIRRVTSKN